MFKVDMGLLNLVVRRQPPPQRERTNGDENQQRPQAVLPPGSVLRVWGKNIRGSRDSARCQINRGGWVVFD